MHMNSSVFLVITLIFSVWLITLTLFFLKFYNFIQKATKQGRDASFLELLAKTFENEKENAESLHSLSKKVKDLEEDGALHIQKMGLLRFNPFKDTGGDQSFILALLDKHDTGVLISSLHTRTGTRWYAKKIVHGKGIEYQLSSDEERALKVAAPLK